LAAKATTVSISAIAPPSAASTRAKWIVKRTRGRPRPQLVHNAFTTASARRAGQARIIAPAARARAPAGT
jgi:hypothetical protein